MKAPTIVSMVLWVGFAAGCAKAPLLVAPSLPFQPTAAASSQGLPKWPYPKGTTLMYGAFIKAKVVAKQGTFEGQPVFLVVSTPDSENKARVRVTFPRAFLNGKPLPNVGDPVAGMLSYPLVRTDRPEVVAWDEPYPLVLNR